MRFIFILESFFLLWRRQGEGSLGFEIHIEVWSGTNLHVLLNRAFRFQDDIGVNGHLLHFGNGLDHLFPPEYLKLLMYFLFTQVLFQTFFESVEVCVEKYVQFFQHFLVGILEGWFGWKGKVERRMIFKKFRTCPSPFLVLPQTQFEFFGRLPNHIFCTTSSPCFHLLLRTQHF